MSGHSIEAGSIGIAAMGEGMGGRNLQLLVGDVRRGYLRRALPPPWLIPLLGAVGLAWSAWSGAWLAPLAVYSIVSSGACMHWSRRLRPGPPGWRTLAVLLILWWQAHPGPGYATVLLLVAIACAVQALLQVAAAIRFAARLDRCARALDQGRLMRLLPAEARQDVHAWQAGDDSKTAQLALVVHLAVLHAALGKSAPASERLGTGLAA